jgi:hypothetical protein
MKPKHSWNYNSKELKCSECGKAFMVPQAHIHKRFTCSNICSGKRKTRIYIEAVKERIEKPCYTCGKILPLNDYYKHNQKPDGRSPVCKKCQVINNRKTRDNNIDKYREKERNKMRKTRISQNRKDIHGIKNKRPYPVPQRCEICNEEKRLVYHHWNNNNFSKGMWICQKCHNAAHWLETFKPSLFYDLKHKIDSSP